MSGDPLTPAASWAPQGRTGKGGGGSDDDDDDVPDLRRSTSALARFGRTVSRLGSARSSKARQAEAAAAVASQAQRLPASTSPGGTLRSPQPPQQPPQQQQPQHRELHGAPPRGGHGAAVGGSSSYNNGSSGGSSSASRLKQLQEGRFDVDANLGALTEKGVAALRAELAGVEAEVGQRLKAAVHDQYPQFVRATPGILRLEGELQQLRTLLQSMGSAVDGLKEVAAVAAQSHRQGLGAGDADFPAGTSAASTAWRESGEGARWLECLDDADVAVAERRVGDALVLLRRLDKLLQRLAAAADRQDPAEQARLDELSGEMEARRERLAAIAEQQILQPLALPADIRAGAELLRSIAGPQYALAAVLEAYSAKLKRRQAALLRPANSGGGDADGADYAAALGQKLALSLQAAALDAEAVFWPSAGAAGGGGGGWSIGGSSVAALGAAFLAWALQETERACHLLRKHALLPFAAPAGLHAFSRCAFAFTAHCAALEAPPVGLQLLPTVLRELWPLTEQVLSRRARKLGEALRRAVGTEVGQLAGGGVPAPRDPAAWECLEIAFPSAPYLLDELEAMAGDCRRLASPRLAAALRRCVGSLYHLYTASLAMALGRHLKAAGVAAASEGAVDPDVDGLRERLAASAEGAMELCTLLAERWLPEALLPMSEQYGEMCSAGVLGGHLARMGAALGMTTVPLTPGGSELLLPDEAEPPPPPPPEAALELLPPEDEEGGQQPSPAAVPGGGDVTAAL